MGSTDFHKSLRVQPGSAPKLASFDPSFHGQHESHESSRPEVERALQRLTELQYLLYAERRHSVLVVLQGIDAAGKDGVCRHVLQAMSPQGCRVTGFKQPTPVEAAHDFLWRVHRVTPGAGEMAVFNRSHYEDVLVARVHGLVPEQVWKKRYDRINEFERLLADSGTTVVKLFLYISKEEQLARFKERLDEPSHRWKISESDYTERQHWDEYIEAYEAMLAQCSTAHAPWYVVPSNHKWFRNLAVSQILCSTMEGLGMELPAPTVDLARIRREYHAAEREAEKAK